MEIYINRSLIEVASGISLAALLSHEGIAAEGIAVAVDNKVIPRAEWAAKQLHAGAKVTVIRAVCGG